MVATQLKLPLELLKTTKNVTAIKYNDKWQGQQKAVLHYA